METGACVYVFTETDIRICLQIIIIQIVYNEPNVLFTSDYSTLVYYGKNPSKEKGKYQEST